LAFLSDFCEAENERFDSDEEKILEANERMKQSAIREIFLYAFIR